jgi:hypothetical protein
LPLEDDPDKREAMMAFRPQMVSLLRAVLLPRLVRTITVPLICALLGLSGVASARLGAEMQGLSGKGIAFSLCLAPDEHSPGAPPGHDCEACCLISAKMLPPPGVPGVQPARWIQRQSAAAKPHAPVNARHPLPWSRGPPAAA